MMKGSTLFLSIMTLLFIGEISYSAEIQGLRVWPAPDKTRVVFDLSEATEFEAFTIKNPDRVVIDFKNSKARDQLIVPVSKNKLLKKIRSAEKQNNLYRVVLDLRHKVNIASFPLGPENDRGHRVVIDLLDPSVTHKSRQVKPVVAKQSQPKPDQSESRQHRKDVPKLTMRDLVVAVDAGHGGKDPGATGKRGTKEKNVVLSIAKKLAKKINNTKGMRAVLTRKSDNYLSLRKRIEIARKNNADLFISIHADAFKNHSVQGSSVYVLSENGASDEAARWLAEKENSVDFIGGVKLDTEDERLKEVLIDLSQNAVLDASSNIANKVLGGLKRVGKVHKPNVQHAGFVVLKSPDIPSILIETGFITNPSEERKLLNPRQQNKLVSAIHSGIKRYFSEYAPPGTRLASK